MSTALMPNPAQPWRVTTAEGEVRLIVVDKFRDDVPAYAGALAGRAARKVALRIGGGCSNMSADDKTGMLDFFSRELAGYEGIVTSGSTRAAKDGAWDPMVTDVPAVIAARNPSCVTLGTAPRTADYFRLTGDSRFVLDENGQGPNPGMHVILLVQHGHTKPLDWDGDLDLAFDLMNTWKQAAQFQIGWIGWNGGGVTEKELLRSAKAGYPTFLVKGSGRKTDELVGRLEKADPELAGLPLIVADKSVPGHLRELLTAKGFLG